MPMVNLDFSNVSNRDPLEPGLYHCRIASAEMGTSSAGNPMIKVTYDVIGDADGNEVPGGRKLWDNLAITEAAMWKIQQVLVACGFEIPEGGQLPNFDTDELVGCDLGIVVVQDTYQGQVNNKTKAYKSMEQMAGDV